MENQVEQTAGSAATLVQRGADAVGIEEGAAAEKEDEGKEKVDERSANQKKDFQVRLFCCAIWHYVIHQADSRILEGRVLGIFLQMLRIID